MLTFTIIHGRFSRSVCDYLCRSADMVVLSDSARPYTSHVRTLSVVIDDTAGMFHCSCHQIGLCLYAILTMHRTGALVEMCLIKVNAKSVSQRPRALKMTAWLGGCCIDFRRYRILKEVHTLFSLARIRVIPPALASFSRLQSLRLQHRTPRHTHWESDNGSDDKYQYSNASHVGMWTHTCYVMCVCMCARLFVFRV